MEPRGKIILLELPEPWEKGCQEASERKASTRSWMTGVVVTNREFPIQSMWRLAGVGGLRSVWQHIVWGITGKNRLLWNWKEVS